MQPVRAAPRRRPPGHRGLPRFDKVLVVVRPHGGYIASGAKTLLVKSRRYRMERRRLLVVERKRAIALLRLAAPTEVSLAGFRRARRRHLVTDAERRRWWPGRRRFFLYPVASVRRLRRPVAVQYPRGPQTFVRPETLRAVRPAGAAPRRGRRAGADRERVYGRP